MTVKLSEIDVCIQNMYIWYITGYSIDIHFLNSVFLSSPRFEHNFNNTQSFDRNLPQVHCLFTCLLKDRIPSLTRLFLLTFCRQYGQPLLY